MTFVRCVVNIITDYHGFYAWLVEFYKIIDQKMSLYLRNQCIKDS